MPAEFSIRKKIVFGIFLTVFVVCAIEVSSYITIRLSRLYLDEQIRRTPDIFREQSAKIRNLLNTNSRGRTVFDSNLGWRYRANYRANSDRLNSQGVRSEREYSDVSAQGVIRVAAFGNSFVYCNEVENKDSWPVLVEEKYPDMEILNYGVGGYGLAQAYLRFVAEGSILSPHVVIIGFAPVMLGRTVNVYRRFISNRESPLVKPRYVLGPGKELVLLPSPLQDISEYEKYLQRPREIIKLGKHDHWYEPAIYENPLYNVSATVRLAAAWIRLRNRYIDSERLFRAGVFNRSSTAFRIQVALLKRFVKDIRASGAKAIITIFPDRGSVSRAIAGQEKVYDPLIDELKAMSLEYVDLSNAFLALGTPPRIEQWFMSGGHYSPLGNQIVADWLMRHIHARFAEEPSALTKLGLVGQHGEQIVLPQDFGRTVANAQR